MDTDTDTEQWHPTACVLCSINCGLEVRIDGPATLLSGHITLPNGFGLGPGGSSDAVGVAPNELTSSEDRDWFAGTPHHKHVRARLERISSVGV